MPTHDEYNLLYHMRLFGGGFASRLADAWMHADEKNQAILRREYGALLESYRKFFNSNTGNGGVSRPV